MSNIYTHPPKHLTIAVDFDGTIYAADTYPLIGEMLPYAKSIINVLYDRGHTIIINTCRIDIDVVKSRLDDDGIKYHYINENSPERIERFGGNDSRKISADVYIDDNSVYNKLHGINWLMIFTWILKIEWKMAVNQNE